MIAHQIANHLKGEDYRVLIDIDSLSIGIDFEQQIAFNIDEAVQHGFVLVLLSAASLQSSFVLHEINYALQKASEHTSNVVPIIVKDKELVLYSAMGAVPKLMERNAYDFTTGSLEENLTQLVSDLKRRAMS